VNKEGMSFVSDEEPVNGECVVEVYREYYGENGEDV
jgi:hypothetical protein